MKPSSKPFVPGGSNNSSNSRNPNGNNKKKEPIPVKKSNDASNNKLNNKSADNLNKNVYDVKSEKSVLTEMKITQVSDGIVEIVKTVENPVLKDPETELDYLLEDYGKHTDITIKRILELMDQLSLEYRSLYQFCGPAMYKFLKGGDLTNKDFIIDIPYIIVNNIEGDPNMKKFPWKAFMLALSRLNIDYSKEIYLNKVNDTQKLIDVYKLDFVDSRLEYSIIRLQQRIRGIHIDKKIPIPEKYINLTSIKQIKKGLPDNAELSIMSHNRNLIPEYLFDYYLCSKGDGEDMAVSCFDVEVLIDPSRKLKLKDLYKVKEDIIKKYLNKYNTDDDMLKLERIIEFYDSNKMNLWKYNKLDALKFVCMNNEHPASCTDFVRGRPNVLGTQFKDYWLKRLMYYHLNYLAEVFKYLDDCRYSWGLQAMQDLTVININGLTVKELKEWYLLMTVGFKDDSGINNFKEFLLNEDPATEYHRQLDMLLYMKNTLLSIKDKIVKGKPIVSDDDVIHFHKPTVVGIVIKNVNNNH